ncbi:MAG: hypothetical protein V5A39_03075 [Haloarculaceae archaeon]
MRRSSDRGQFEPVVALAAVLAISAGLVTYADVLDRRLPGEQNRETARTTLDSVHDKLRVAGVIVPSRLDRAIAAAPDGWRVNLTLRTREGYWQRGPDPPGDGLAAERRVSVRVGPSKLSAGTLRVVIWR